MTTGYVPIYDLEDMSEAQRQDYVKAVCSHLGIPDNLNLIRLTYYDEGDGPRRLVCYAKRGAAELIREKYGVSTVDTKTEPVGGSYVVTVTGVSKDGRKEMGTGSKFIAGLTGRALDDAIMTAHTRAVRRMALQFTGTGILDESEVNLNETVELKNITTPVIPAIPTVPVSDAPGKDVTEKLDQFIGQKEKIDEAWKQQAARAAVVAELNAAFKKAPKIVEETVIEHKKDGTAKVSHELTEDAPVAPKKRGRPRKNHVDLGTVPAPTTQAAAPVAPPPQVPSGAVPIPAKAEKVTVATPTPTPAAPPSKAKLNAEQIQPYRGRLFKLVSELEKAGFAPKLGKGNYDKMRSFACTMFPDVKDFNELTENDWNTYLLWLEKKVKEEGAAATGKYIEDSIGI